MRARRGRIQGRKVRSTGRKSRGVALDSSGMAKVSKRVSAKPQNQYSTDDEKESGGGEGGLDIEGAPEEADHEAGDEVAHGVDGGERAEGHAVLLFGDEFGGERIFERFFRADVETRENKNHGEQAQGMCSGAEQERGDAGSAVARAEHRFAVRNMVAEPAARVGWTGIEDVWQGAEA